MTRNITLQKAKEFITAQGGQLAPLSVSEEELNPDTQDDLTLHAEPLESVEQAYAVPYSYPEESDHSDFRFFEDGRQRTVQVGYLQATFGTMSVLVPVHYYVVASVILQRVDRKLTLWKEPIVDQGILVPRSLIPNQSVLAEFVDAGLTVVDTEPQGGNPGDYYDMRRRALRLAKDRRLAVEQHLITQWRSSATAEQAFVVVDGTLMNMRDEKNVERCVGVSKSFGSRYFEVPDHTRILQMKEFERSWTFRFHEPDEDLRKGGRERVSWYLRLRDGHGVDPEFGLIRVEIGKTYIHNASLKAEQFSRSLLSERLPTSYPAPRWDKHLYPICACENYLRSILPSISTITAVMQG